MHDAIKTPTDYGLVLRRRKWYFIVPAVLVLAIAALTAYVWPPTYRSEAIILVEQAEIPEDLVNTVIDDYVERRLEAITRRILVSDNLLRIIEQYNLYQEERRREPITAVIEKMREKIRKEMISTETVNPSSGSRSQATVAFEVSFEHRRPEVAQRVTNELVSLYLNENLRSRRQRAMETASFIGEERERVEQRIAEVGQELAEYKRANGGSLPEDLQYNQQQIALAQQELGDLERRSQSLKEREIFLQAQLALLDPHLVSGDVWSPTTRLKNMQVDLATMRARYGSEHPDVVKLERELDGLAGLVGGTPAAEGLIRERARLRQELGTLSGQYTDDHPDVHRAQRELERIEAELQAARQDNGQNASGAENPAYVQLEAQLAAVRSELSAIELQSAAVGERLKSFQERLAKMPLVEREYGRLARLLADANALRDELSRKEAIARLGQSLETEQKGERFSLIEPPTLPAAPIKPDRGVLLFVGLVLAIGAGFGTVATAESLSDTVVSPRDITSVFEEAPLAVIPRIVTSADRVRAWSLRTAAVGSLVVGLGGAAWWLHTHHLPLDIAWYSLQRHALTKLDVYVSSPASEAVDPTVAR